MLSRSEAKARGLTTYFTGVPCPRGHIANRFTSNRTCSKCKCPLTDRAKARAKTKRLKERDRKRLKRELKRKGQLQARYGVTPERYLLLLEKQGGVCAICEQRCTTGRALAVDHCHSTGAIRGLLCANCNHALGKLKDSALLLQRAAEYIRASEVVSPSGTPLAIVRPVTTG